MRLLVVLALLAIAVAPSSAFAGNVAGSSPDPVDQPPALSGDQTPDVVSVVARYDSDIGAVAADVVFSAPVSATSPYNVDVTMSTPSLGICFGGISLFAGTSSSSTGIVDRTGATGALPLVLTWDAGRTSLHMQASNPGLAGVSVTCGNASTSIPDDIGHCGNASCSYISHTYTSDTVADFGIVPSTDPVLRVATPVATPGVTSTATAKASTAAAKTRLTVDAKSNACRRAVVIFSSNVHRDGATGRIRYTLHGPGVLRTFSARAEAGEDSVGHEFRRLRPGAYTLTARYLGGLDRSDDVPVKLLASPSISKHFRLKACA